MRRLITLLVFLTCASTAQLAWGKTVLTFEGQYDFSQSLLNLTIERKEGKLITDIKRKDDNSFDVKVNVDHLKTPFFDFSSEIESLIEFNNEGDEGLSTLSGKIWSNFSLVNYKPIREISGNYHFKDDKLTISYFRIGQLTCNGFVDLNYPYDIDLEVGIESINLDEFLSFGLLIKNTIQMVMSPGLLNYQAA